MDDDPRVRLQTFLANWFSERLTYEAFTHESDEQLAEALRADLHEQGFHLMSLKDTHPGLSVEVIPHETEPSGLTHERSD